jgi:hypothetical protein
MPITPDHNEIVIENAHAMTLQKSYNYHLIYNYNQSPYQQNNYQYPTGYQHYPQQYSSHQNGAPNFNKRQPNEVKEQASEKSIPNDRNLQN